MTDVEEFDGIDVMALRRTIRELEIELTDARTQIAAMSLVAASNEELWPAAIERAEKAEAELAAQKRAQARQDGWLLGYCAECSRGFEGRYNPGPGSLTTRRIEGPVHPVERIETTTDTPAGGREDNSGAVAQPAEREILNLEGAGSNPASPSSSAAPLVQQTELPPCGACGVGRRQVKATLSLHYCPTCDTTETGFLSTLELGEEFYSLAAADREIKRLRAEVEYLKVENAKVNQRAFAAGMPQGAMPTELRLREALADVVAAMRVWGSWEDGVPEEGPDEMGSVGAAFNRAVALLESSKEGGSE